MLIKSDQTRPSVDTRGAEPYRPQYHFTARKNWINDPNGLVYFDGEYHLFFQYNPFGKDWGHMSWGHAVSPDLVHWRELEIAIPETDQMIFSGSVIVDHENLSGLGDGTSPPLLAYFTAFDERRGIQSQHLAFSHDRGRTFSHFERNPIIDHDLADFRDPKVFYHADSAGWIMVVAMAREHTIRFYRSDNLLDWNLAGSFGPSGSVSGQWECPDLFQIPVEGQSADRRWVLKVDVDSGLVDGGSGAQYFVGDFDGYAFEPDPATIASPAELVDLGPDFYAAVTWSNLPASTPGPVWIAWQSNHQSGKAYPTHPWRGSMSVPRTLFLFEESGRLRLGQRPVAFIGGLRRTGIEPKTQASTTSLASILFKPDSSFEQQVVIEGGDATSAELVMRVGTVPLLTVSIRFDRSEVAFERHDGSFQSNGAFARATATRLPAFTRMDLTIFFDRSTVEIFVNDGRRVYSACIFPDGDLTMEINGSHGANVVLGETFGMAQSIDFGE